MPRFASFLFSGPIAISFMLGGVSCHPLSSSPHAGENSAAPCAGKYEQFIAQSKRYPATMEIFRDKELLQKASADSFICISISQQRGRLYVQGKVAADWPVSTGIAGRETPVGSFTIQSKSKEHSSSRYGRMVDASGACTNRDADTSKDAIPPGGRFIGASMPNWMRLTNNGIGIHSGKVRAGRQLSHGCIRTPHAMASQLFSIARVGTRVTITQGLEACYPQAAAAQLAGNKRN